MPWDVRENFGDCKGFAVVAVGSDEIIQCHTDRATANQHVVDLYAAMNSAAGGDPVMAAAEEMKKRRKPKPSTKEYSDPEFVPTTQFVPTPNEPQRIKRDDGGVYIQ